MRIPVVEEHPMRSGFLGLVLIFSTGAGLAWGQYPEGASVGGTSPIIPPQLPGYQNAGPGGMDPNGNPMYPPPGNWESNDLSGPAGGSEGATPRWWFTGEYLMWYPKAVNYSAPLVTNSSPGNRGVIGNVLTMVVDGDERVNFGMVSGFRLNGGTWCDASGRYGLDFSGFGMESKTVNFVQGNQPGIMPLIARPFIDSRNNIQGAYLVTSPTFATGYVVDATSTNAWGAEANYLINLYRSPPESGHGYSLTFLTGFRFFQLEEGVNLISASSLFPGASANFNNSVFTAAAGPTPILIDRIDNGFNGLGPNISTIVRTSSSVTTVNLNIFDQIKTINNFYGTNLGLYQQLNHGRWSFGLTAKLGLGVMHQAVHIDGYSNLQTTASTTTNTLVVRQGAVVLNNNANTFNFQNNIVRGGLYNQANSIGIYQRNQFGVLPEFNFRIAYSLSSSITTFVSYNAMFLNGVVRAPSLVTGQVNPALQPTSAEFGNLTRPQQTDKFPSTDYWLQGITFGLSIRF